MKNVVNYALKVLQMKKKLKKKETTKTERKN